MESLRLQVPGLVILSHPDPDRVGETVALPRLASGQALALSRLEPSFATPGPGENLRPLDDPYLSRQPVLLVPDPNDGSILLDRGASRTVVTVGGEPLDRRQAFSAADVERGVVLVLSQRVALLLQLLDPVPVTVPSFGLVGESSLMLRLRQEIRSAAALDAPVLLRGETGTGKELVARALHQESGRHGPYVAVNMGTLSPSLAAAELFGAVRGAYTGADRKKEGYFQGAQGGTLFLDEIGEAPPEIQVMLLRALENREIQPVGSVEAIAIDVRVIAATDAALETAIADGRFRAPLLHRLAGFEIHLPALRQRRDDIARLLFHFLQEESLNLLGSRLRLQADAPPWPPAELVARLVEHDWPGNVRQLRNVARRLLIARRDGLGDTDLARLVERMTSEALPTPPAPPAGVTPRPAPAGKSQKPPEGFYRRYRKAESVDQDELIAALEKHAWELVPTAAELGVSRPTLYRLIESCPQIRKASELERREIEAALADHEPQEAAARLKVSFQGLKRRIKQLGIG